MCFRVIKLILLEFVNNFLSLFYIAFWLGDVKMIANQLMTQLIVFQVNSIYSQTICIIACQMVTHFLCIVLDCSKIHWNGSAIDNAQVISIEEYIYGRFDLGSYNIFPANQDEQITNEYFILFRWPPTNTMT